MLATKRTPLLLLLLVTLTVAQFNFTTSSGWHRHGMHVWMAAVV